jgi:hypothetical protein
MSEHKSKIMVAVVLALTLVLVLAGASYGLFPSQSMLPALITPEDQQPTSVATPAPSPTQTPAASTNPQSTQQPSQGPLRPTGPATGPITFIGIPLSSTVDVNVAEGFHSSILAMGTTSSLLFVLPQEENGSVPLLISSTKGINETVSVSLSVYLPSGPSNVNGGNGSDIYSGVSFNVSPSNFVLSPGGQVKAFLNVTAGKNALTSFYLNPGVNAQTNSSSVLDINIPTPSILVSNFTPSCLVLVSSHEPNPIYRDFSVFPPEPLPSTPDLLVIPTLNMSPGENTTVLYSCLAQDNLSLNATPPTGFSAQISPDGPNILFSNLVMGKTYAVTISAASNVGSGTYKVNVVGSLNSQQFDGSFHVAVS